MASMSGDYGAGYLAWEREFGAEWCLNDDHPSACQCHVLGRQAANPSIFATGRGWVHFGKARCGASAEDDGPTGQAADWCDDVREDESVPLSGLLVAKQVARLCRDDGQVAISWRSLSDAVGRKDKAGRTRAYTERGVEALVSAGWLTVETVGEKRGARTTFYLMIPDSGTAGMLRLVA